MFPGGYANFSYQRKIGHLSSLRTTEVACGSGNLESALGEELYIRGLEFLNGNLTVDKGKGEITFGRSFISSENGPSVSYSRLYPPQEGYEEMMEIVERMLGKESLDQSGRVFLPLSNVFKRYLVENLGFTENVVFSTDTSSRAWIQGTVRFANPADFGALEEHAEYSICLSDPFMEEISEAYRRNSGRNLSARRQKVLARREEPLKIDTFLRVVDIHSASSKYENRKVYRNLRKCSSFLMDITFGNAI